MFRTFVLGLALATSSFGMCHADTISGREIYVIDGDTIDYRDTRYRLVGLDTPETYRHQCDYELALGNTATTRLRSLVTGGQIVDLRVQPGLDRYGRSLARLYVGGTDIADTLVSEGRARRYNGGRRQPWC